MDTTCCADDPRRRRVREAGLTGIDAVEVGPDRQTLTVFFLGRAPDGLSAANFRIDGGPAHAPLSVVRVETCRPQDLALDDCVRLVLDRAGGAGAHRLRLVDLDPAPDPLYAEHPFRFHAGRSGELDCSPRPAAALQPPETLANYLAKDYAGFRQLILDRLALLMPAWRERHVPDIGITLVELLAYVGDHLSYYQDAVATEAYIGTARRRISVRRHARLIDYQLHEGCNARTWVSIAVDSFQRFDPTAIYFITGVAELDAAVGRALPHHTVAQLPAHSYEVFEPLQTGPIELSPGHNAISFYTWGRRVCCLERGATSVALVDGPPGSAANDASRRRLRLRPGDFLLLEEVSGPHTGHPADADPAHRHIVRLTTVEPGFDALYAQPILTVAWAPEDALPFALPISAIGAPPECRLLHDISVARGNLVLVDHGRTVEEDLAEVPLRSAALACAAEGELAEEREEPGRYAPALRQAPLTFRQPLSTAAPASATVLQDQRGALPAIELRSLQAASEGVRACTWHPVLDLLMSGPTDPHFVAEIDNQGRAHLRFGDGELGQRPEAQTAFVARYRVGNGPAGNVGAEAVRHLVLRSGMLSGVRLEVRNPLPARGGTAPENLDEARLYAPHSAGSVRESAATADDYAAFARRDFPHLIQRARGRLSWTGSCYEVRVAIDPYGLEPASPALCRQIRERLERYRRINHEVVVAPARYVPLEIALTVDVRPTYQRGHVKAALLDLFSSRDLPDGRRGLFHPNNLSFGDPIFLSPLIAAARSVPGVADVQINTLQRLGEPPDDALTSGVLRIDPDEIARMEDDPNFPERGQLTLAMRGGR